MPKEKPSQNSTEPGKGLWQNLSDPIQNRIKTLRILLTVHSYLYYTLYESVVTDDQWQEWANELRDLQNANPDQCKIDLWDDLFKDWTGDTGMHLDTSDWVLQKALYVQRLPQIVT